MGVNVCTGIMAMSLEVKSKEKVDLSSQPGAMRLFLTKGDVVLPGRSQWAWLLGHSSGTHRLDRC